MCAEDAGRPVFFPGAKAFRNEIERVEGLAGQTAEARVLLVVLDVVAVEALMNAFLPALDPDEE